MRGRKGFTLIELLVVIAIIAILAAILFPVFAQARAKARQASCLSNMKQMSLAVLMYADDYDENVVYRGRRATPDGVYSCWPGGWTGYKGVVTGLGSLVFPDLLYPYVKNAGLYICPTVGEATYGGCAPRYGGIMANHCTFSEYEPACVEHVIYQYAGKPCTRNLGQFTNPSNSVMFGDGGCFFICKDDGINNDPYDELLKTTWPYMYDQVRRHNGGSNFSFFDGHARWSKPESMSEKQFEAEGLPKKFIRS